MHPSAIDPGSLPPGAWQRHYRFVEQPPPEAAAAFAFSPPAVGWAVELDDAAAGAGRLAVLAIPCTDPEESPWQERARSWAEGGAAGGANCSTVILQHALVLTGCGRLAVLAAEDRLEALVRAAVETACHDLQLGDLERELAGNWAEWQADVQLTQTFNERTLARQDRFRRRFGEVTDLALRAARLAAPIHAPHVHPPTLASQVQERLRDRRHLAHRHETLTDQLGTFQQFYEGCWHRVNDHLLARSSRILEWTIIILLGLQILLFLYEILGSLPAQ
jgi:hypothetical protein